MAKKRIPEVPRDGSDADFVAENYMLIDGAEGSAKMRMDLFGKASAIEELDEVKYEMPEGGIPKDDLSEAVQGSLDLADSALQASDIEGKAEKSEMSITNVSGDTTKKNIQLKTGLSQNVVVDHQDISGKADKSEMSVSAVSGDDTKKTIQLKSGLTQNVVIEHQDISGKADTSAMSITDVSGDATKKKIQLKTGLSQNVVVDHQDISGKADKSEMSISAGEDDTKRTIQLKNGTSQSVVVSHQNIDGKAEKSEMDISAVSGDETKKKIQLKSGLTQNVVVEHQDISGKAEKSEMSISAVSGDATKMKIQLKSGTSQNVVVEHQDISGKADKSELSINAVSGDDTKKTIQLKSGVSQDVVVDVSGKADAEDVLTTWQPVAVVPATGKLKFNSTKYPTRTEIVLKDATRPGGTIAQDVVVGYTVPNIELGDVGKFLMVDSLQGTSWQSVEHTLSYPSATAGEYDTMQGIIAFQTDNTPRRTSAYLTFVSGDPECLGMLVPPVKREDAGRFLTVDETDGAVWRDLPRAETEWEHLNPYTQEFGVLKFVTSFNEEETDVWVNHHTSAYIGTVDASGWVGEFLPHYETSDSGKILMVDPTNGPEWTNMPDPEIVWRYGTDSRDGKLIVGTSLVEEDSELVPHHSSAYIEYNDSETWVGAFVPPTDGVDSSKVLMVDPSNGVEWKDYPAVRYDTIQDLTDSQKSRARKNIDAQGDLGYMQAIHTYSSAHSAVQYVKICTLDLDPAEDNIYMYNLSLDIVLGSSNNQSGACESGRFDASLGVYRDTNVYRFEGRWTGYGNNGDDERRSLTGIRVYQKHDDDGTSASTGRPLKHVEIWAVLTKYFSEFDYMTVTALVNHGHKTTRRGYSDYTTIYEKPWVFSNSYSRPQTQEPQHTDTTGTTYTVDDFPARADGSWHLIATSSTHVSDSSFTTVLPQFTSEPYSRPGSSSYPVNANTKYVLKVTIQRDADIVPTGTGDVLSFDTDHYVMCDMVDSSSHAIDTCLAQMYIAPLGASEGGAYPAAVQWLDMSNVSGNLYISGYGKYPLITLAGVKATGTDYAIVKAELYEVENGQTGEVLQGY